MFGSSFMFSTILGTFQSEGLVFNSLFPVGSLILHLVMFLSSLSSETSIFERFDPGACLAQRKCDSQHVLPMSMQELQAAISIFELVLFVPVEYLSRICRTDLVQRAFTADIVISMLPVNDTHTSTFVTRSLTVLRVFLRRNFSSMGVGSDQTTRSVPPGIEIASTPRHSAPIMPQFLEYLLEEGQSVLQPGGQDIYTSVTVDLIESQLL
jgi:hypothetical protein